MSGLFSRVSAVMTANLHEAVDQIEDPAVMSRQLMREWAQEIDHSRRALLQAAATCKTLERRIDQLAPKARRWKNQAEAQLKADHENEAKESLRRALLLEESVDALNTTLTQARGSKQRLADRLAKIKNDQLRAQAQASVIDARSKLVGTAESPLLAAAARRDRMQHFSDRLQHSECLIEAETEIGLDDELSDDHLMQENRLDDAMNAMKQRLENSDK